MLAGWLGDRATRTGGGAFRLAELEGQGQQHVHGHGLAIFYHGLEQRALRSLAARFVEVVVAGRFVDQDLFGQAFFIDQHAQYYGAALAEAARQIRVDQLRRLDVFHAADGARRGRCWRRWCRCRRRGWCGSRYWRRFGARRLRWRDRWLGRRHGHQRQRRDDGFRHRSAQLDGFRYGRCGWFRRRRWRNDADGGDGGHGRTHHAAQQTALYRIESGDMQGEDSRQRHQFATLLVEGGKLLHSLHRYRWWHHRHAVHRF